MTNSVKDRADNSVQTPDYASLDDDAIIRLIRDQRDRRALTELYVRYQHSLARYMQRGMNNSKLIEEAYNDVMLTVWKSAANFQGKSKVSTWLYGIARNKRMTHFQRENKHAHQTSEDQLEGIAEHDNSSLKETLSAALIELTEPHREVIELAYFHGYSTAEISEIVACPVNTVKTRLFHARQKLKAVIESESNLGGGTIAH